MFTVKIDKYSDRQLRHISLIVEFIQQIEYIQGDENVVPDVLSRLEAVLLDAQLPDATTLSRDQAEDPELQYILSGNLDSALRLEARDIGVGVFYFNTSAPSRSCTYVPAMLRQRIFDILHNYTHPGIKATLALIKERHSWPDMNHQVRDWARNYTV